MHEDLVLLERRAGREVDATQTARVVLHRRPPPALLLMPGELHTLSARYIKTLRDLLNSDSLTKACSGRTLRAFLIQARFIVNQKHVMESQTNWCAGSTVSLT